MRSPSKHLLSTLAAGVMVMTPLLATPPASATSTIQSANAAAAACTASYSGSIRWQKGKIWAYGSAANCGTVKYAKVCATLWYHTVQASQPWRQKCQTLGRNHSVGFSSPTANCVAGQMSVNIVVTNSSGKAVGSKWTRNVDTTGGCPSTGSSNAS